MKRTLLVALLVLLPAAPARAYWRGTGAGAGAALTDTLAAGNTPSVSVAGRDVTVSWSQTAFHGGRLGSFAGGSYTVRRYPSAGGAAVTPSGTCATAVSGTSATLSCTDATVPYGSWRYTVTPSLSTSWTAAESGLSAVAAVVPDAPVLTAAAGPGGRVNLSWPAVTGATGYNVFRRTTGSYDYSAPLNGGTPVSGTSYSDLATSDGTTYHYVVRALAGTTASADSAEASATADATAPTGVTLTDPGSPLRGAVALAGSASDGGSGIDTLTYQYAPTGTSGWAGACTGSTTPFGCSWATGAVADGVYDLRVVATDRAGNSTTSAAVTGRRIDNTAPTATLNDPGTLLRATVSLTSTVSDAGSGLASVKVQVAAAGTGSWSDVCTGTTGASPCAFDTTQRADGTYDLRLVAVDAAGNQTTAVLANRTIDNTKPTATDVQTANGGTAGTPDAGDTVTLSFSEPMAPGSVLSGWTGASTGVTVRISNVTNLLTVFNAGNTTQLPLGQVALGQSYAVTSLVFNATMVRSGSTITLTLGTSTSGLAATALLNGTMAWTTSTTPTDLAGNTLTAGTVNETGAADRDF